MYFQKHNPNLFFSNFIDCYFTIDTSLLNASVEDLVVPDGTFGLIFIDTKNSIRRSLSTVTESIPLQRTSVFGQKTHAVNYHITPVDSKIFGIKIKPSGMFLFTKEAFEIKDLFEDIHSLNNKELIAIEQEIFDAKTIQNKIDIIEGYIVQRLKSSQIDSDLELMRCLLNFIFEHKGNIRFDFLVKHFDLNYKKVERLFMKYVGMSPKSYIRIIRFNACINLSKINKTYSLTELALDNGFFDQSHLIREFKKITSLTPKQFFKKERSYSEIENLNIINSRWQKNAAV
jgi:AraC-like DNA-binding protein